MSIIKKYRRLNMNCENIKCNKEHDGLFGSGRFCSRSCANQKTHSQETKEKIKNTLKNSDKWKNYKKVIKSSNFKKSPVSIYDLSSRTIQKLLKRANVECSMCGWNKTTLDIHHIIPKAKGGSNEHTNLIALCPNCHRLAHEKQYSTEQLFLKTLDITFPNWKNYYNVSSDGVKPPES